MMAIAPATEHESPVEAMLNALADVWEAQMTNLSAAPSPSAPWFKPDDHQLGYVSGQSDRPKCSGQSSANGSDTSPSEQAT